MFTVSDFLITVVFGLGVVVFTRVYFVVRIGHIFWIRY
jgi:hypothetical protein